MRNTSSSIQSFHKDRAILFDTLYSFSIFGNLLPDDEFIILMNCNSGDFDVYKAVLEFVNSAYLSRNTAPP
jgi:hypothetical protein